MPEPREHAKSRGWIETVLRKIPGFKGYLEKEYRRDSDRLQRTWLADRLQRAKRGLDECSRTLVDAGQIDALAPLERLRARLDKVIARIRGAMQGYSGMFDLVQIDEKVLDEVYESDVALMNKVELLADTVDNLRTASAAETATQVSDLLAKLDEFEGEWDKREDLLKGLK